MYGSFRVLLQVLWAQLLCGWVLGSELTFELPDNAKQCFYEDIIIGTKCTLEFQVVTGGHYDVDCRLEDPEATTLYKEMKKQYDSFTFTAAKNGTYKFCFSNEFSTFTHKTVYFDFQVGDDPPLFPNENRVTALTQMESACVSIHEALKSVIDYQTHFRLREAQGRSRAEDLNTRVAFWSIGEAIILLVPRLCTDITRKWGVVTKHTHNARKLRISFLICRAFGSLQTTLASRGFSPCWLHLIVKNLLLNLTV
ncbi:transmembrane emp24 domain-containing protein 7 [Scomber scombrus]|uniref:Transmembrane emp24 domain-containing protein 7 n=1 Tax=Scomber scombrus TaxID=13677 RepID=A0AAV1MTZ6_SCOSC